MEGDRRGVEAVEVVVDERRRRAFAVGVPLSWVRLGGLASALALLLLLPVLLPVLPLVVVVVPATLVVRFRRPSSSGGGPANAKSKHERIALRGLCVEAPQAR